MKISFLGQGFEDKSVAAVGNHLMNFLGQKGEGRKLSVISYLAGRR